MKALMTSAAMASAVLWASSARAATMDAILANTLTTQGADGAVVRWTFNADGTYRMTLPSGQSSGGAYARTRSTSASCTGISARLNVAPLAQGQLWLHQPKF